MTDDEILAAACKIKARRLDENRLKSFQEKDVVMIRWDNLGAKFGESYTSIAVPAKDVAALVEAYFATRIEETLPPYNKQPE